MQTPFFNRSSPRAKTPVTSSPDLRAVELFHKEKWPLWAEPLKLFSQPGDKGLGDIVARKIGLARGAAFKAWFKEKFNRDCGCTNRQIWLNQMFPL